MAHLVETMFSTREKPWHGLGKILDNPPTSKEAIIQAGLDWNVYQTYVCVNDCALDDYMANVRSDNNECLGIVSNHYKILQNDEAFNFMDNLLENKDVVYETAGSLRKGKTIWMLAKMNREYDILGDKVDPYVCLTNTHDGTGAIKILMTPVRIVCNNTLNIATRSTKRSWSTKHMGNITEKVKEAQHTLKLANNYLDQLKKDAEKFYDTYVSEGDFKEIVNMLIPIPEIDMSVRTRTNLEEKQAELIKCYNASDITQFKNTGWGVINAVTDFVAHTQPKRLTSNYQESIFQRVVNGDPLVDKVTELLLV